MRSRHGNVTPSTTPWRGLYRLVGDRFVIAAIAPEAQHDPNAFMRACGAAAKRLRELEE